MTGVRWDRSWDEDSGFPDLSNVRELEILINRGIPKRKIESFLHGLKNLEYLSIIGDGAVFQEIDWKIFPFYGSLKSLSLTNIIEFEDTMPLPILQLRDGMLPPNLTNLCLEVGGFGSDPMSELEKLKLLKTLDLQGLNIDLIGKRSDYLTNLYDNAVRIRIRCSSGGFEQLEELKLYGQPLFEEWEIEPGAMPMLKKLHVGFCDPLRVPPELTDRLPSLQKLFRLSDIQDNKDVIRNIYEQKPNLRPF